MNRAIETRLTAMLIDSGIGRTSHRDIGWLRGGCCVYSGFPVNQYMAIYRPPLLLLLLTFIVVYKYFKMAPKKRGMSLEEKRTVIQSIFHDSKSVFVLKVRFHEYLHVYVYIYSSEGVVA